MVAGIGDASRSLNREGAGYSWRIFEVKCPEYTLFEVVPLDLVLLMSRGQMRESASCSGRGNRDGHRPEIVTEIANVTKRV